MRLSSCKELSAIDRLHSFFCSTCKQQQAIDLLGDRVVQITRQALPFFQDSQGLCALPQPEIFDGCSDPLADADQEVKHPPG